MINLFSNKNSFSFSFHFYFFLAGRPGGPNIQKQKIFIHFMIKLFSKQKSFYFLSFFCWPARRAKKSKTKNIYSFYDKTFFQKKIFFIFFSFLFFFAGRPGGLKIQKQKSLFIL